MRQLYGALVRRIIWEAVGSTFLQENNTGKTVVKIPKVNTRDAALVISVGLPRRASASLTPLHLSVMQPTAHGICQMHRLQQSPSCGPSRSESFHLSTGDRTRCSTGIYTSPHHGYNRKAGSPSRSFCIVGLAAVGPLKREGLRLSQVPSGSGRQHCWSCVWGSDGGGGRCC